MMMINVHGEVAYERFATQAVKRARTSLAVKHWALSSPLGRALWKPGGLRPMTEI